MKETLKSLYELVLEINSDKNSEVNILFKQDAKTLEVLVYRKRNNVLFKKLFIADYSKNKKENTKAINKLMAEIFWL